MIGTGLTLLDQIPDVILPLGVRQSLFHHPANQHGTGVPLHPCRMSCHHCRRQGDLPHAPTRIAVTVHIRWNEHQHHDDATRLRCLSHFELDGFRAG